MKLNLTVRSLETEDSLVPQKCLLPHFIFPQPLRPGTWVRCVLAGAENFAVCQVYKRQLSQQQQCCSMDSCVSRTGQRIDNERLERLEPLQQRREPVSAIEIEFMVTEQLFAKRRRKLKTTYLRTAARYFLQTLHLLTGCFVRTSDMDCMGIAAIYVKSANDCTADTVFRIDDETKLQVRNIQLVSSIDDTIAGPPFYTCGFERARQDLVDLITVAKDQQTRRGALRFPLNGLVVGPPGCGKLALIASVIREHKCNCFRIRTADVLAQYPGETEAELRRIFKAARIFKTRFAPASVVIILFENLDLICPALKPTAAFDDAGSTMRICAQLVGLLDELYTSETDIVCLATTSNPDSINEAVRRPQRFEHEITIDALTEVDRKNLFMAMFERSQRNLPVEVAVTPKLLDFVGKQTRGFVAADIEYLTRALEQTLLREESKDLSSIITDTLMKTKPISFRSIDVSVYKTNQGFEAIGGMQSVKHTLEVAFLAGLKKPEAYQRFGLTMPKGLLLYGPPGCAKTTLAKCLATEANMTFITTSSAEVFSPYVGCAEKFIAKIFDTARKNAPCLIFLDEIDTLASRRAFSGDSSSNVQIRVLSALLTEMDGIVSTGGKGDGGQQILVVGASNRPEMIDDAVLRPGRFDRLVHVPAPDVESRRSILALNATRMPFAANVDLELLAVRTPNFSGADLCNLCNEAALQAFQRDSDTEEILAEDFNFVLRKQQSSLTQRQINWYLQFENKYLVSQ